MCGTEGFFVLNRGVFVVGLRDFWCGTERFSGLKRSDPFVWKSCVKPEDVELRGILHIIEFFNIFKTEFGKFRWEESKLLYVDLKNYTKYKKIIISNY